MKVIIDNSGDGQTVFYLKEKKVWIKEVSSWAKSLLACLEFVLKKHRRKINDLSGVAVVVGVGRFTAERIAATVANTLAFALNIPVVALPKANTVVADKKFLSARRGVYISAKYSGEAHIGGKNK
ncbi:MAG: hypothetical protein NTW66_02630 [Candidatus Magasanikbacteria bacterium]|nr:hypothetical protein [Candidatus Magasanikbacteria bacterium]